FPFFSSIAEFFGLLLVRPVRLFVAIALLIEFGSAAMAESVRIDGVRVYGRLQDVSRADIREAIEANGPINKPRELEIVSSSEMHAYYKTRELGWTPVEKLKVMQPANRSFAWTPNGLWVYAPQ